MKFMDAGKTLKIKFSEILISVSFTMAQLSQDPTLFDLAWHL